MQDSKGYIWCSTDRGIVKYDGYGFKTFGNINGLPDNTVFDIFEDSKQRIWFKSYSTATGYIQNNKVYVYPFNHVLKSVHPASLAMTVLFDDKGRLWMSKRTPTGNYTITIIDSTGKKFDVSREKAKLRVYINKEGKCLLSGNVKARNVELYSVETDKKIAEYNGAFLFTHDPFATKTDESGCFFLCIDNRLMRVGQGKIEKLIDCPHKVLSIYADAQENIWIGYQYKGLEMYEAKTGYKKVNTFLNKLSVTCILNDTEGAYWFTTLENGVYYLPPSRVVSYTENFGPGFNRVSKIIPFDGGVLAIFLNSSVALLKNKQLFVVFEPNISNELDISIQDNKLYYTGYYKVDIPINKEKKYLGIGKKIYCGEKNIWVIKQAGIIKLDKQGKRTDSVSFENISRITSAFETTNGNLLVGTLAGLYLCEKNTIRHLAKYNPLFGSRVSDITRINRRYIAVATIGQGVYIFDEHNYILHKHYTKYSGLPSMLCNTITTDGDSAIWVGTNKGVCLITNFLNAQRDDFITMDVNDGIQSNEINQVSIIDNAIWLATANGISVTSRTAFGGKTPFIPVHIEGVQVNNNSVEHGAGGNFTYLQNNINISFVGLHYRHPEKLVYRYRLVGGDSTWNTTTSRSIVYNSLSPGNYIFEVGLINPAGKLNPITATYSFSISPPFYKTLWFIVLVAMAAGLSIYAFVYYRIKTIRKGAQLKDELNNYRDKALRNLMNPHFVYNSLNSVQSYILRNDTIASASLLASFSRLMRLTFNNTSQDRVFLADDIAVLELYASLENQRLHNKFDFIIDIHPSINPQKVLIPPLLIQPFVENSIVHGLAAKEGRGRVTVGIQAGPGVLKISITDDGVGRKEAAIISDKRSKYGTFISMPGKRNKTSGSNATVDRINQLWGKNFYKSEYTIIDLQNSNNAPCGTIVQFCIPLSHD